MEDIAFQIASQQSYGIEFEDIRVYRFTSVRFWKGDKLWRVLVYRSGLPSTGLGGQLGSLSLLLPVVT